ncbi:hypothetical protein GUJ93_ZPchr0007g5065 [Zizania palustris]|uniref:Uncharacterized protein n=1 Tax=Zizania palustris TaxID=103762 RepID=A0A8J5SSL5_ZIZPA|nr:hypothetical protein GUJ93_ZPchr0007g5065 [Zizania palustris]
MALARKSDLAAHPPPPAGECSAPHHGDGESGRLYEELPPKRGANLRRFGEQRRRARPLSLSSYSSLLRSGRSGCEL